MVREEMSENVWEKQHCRHPGQCRRRTGRRCSWYQSWDSSQPMVSETGRALGDSKENQKPLAASEGPHAGAGECLEETVILWEVHAGAMSLKDQWTCGERSLLPRRFAGRTCGCMRNPHWSSLKGCFPWKGPMLEQLMKNCNPGKGFTLDSSVEDCLLWERPEQGKGVRGSLPEEEGGTETMCMPSLFLMKGRCWESGIPDPW